MGGWHTVVSAAAAVVSGGFLATAGVLQQRAASRRPSKERFSLRMIVNLFKDHWWVGGIGAAVLSYGFQAIALAFGPLVLVQPLVVSEMLFAVPISVRLRGLRLRPRDWAAVLAVVIGLAVGIIAANPRQGASVQPITVWAPALVAIAVITAVCLVVARRKSEGPATASAFALAGAAVMGLQSALYASTIHMLGKDVWGTFANWEPYALIVASILGAFLIQNAFQSGPLAASTPVIDATLPLVAIGLGVGIFNESVRTSALGLLGGALGIALVIGGIVGLDTSPVVRKEQQIEAEERDEEDPDSDSDADEESESPANEPAGQPD
ncbi:MAG: DMT family transporter [Nocardioidaceae bacterium]